MILKSNKNKKGGGKSNIFFYFYVFDYIFYFIVNFLIFVEILDIYQIKLRKKKLPLKNPCSHHPMRRLPPLSILVSLIFNDRNLIFSG